MATPKLLLRKLDDLPHDPANARTHGPDQLEAIAHSIRRFGWTRPLLVDDVIRAGNGAASAARMIYAAGERIYMAPGKDHDGHLLPEGTVPVIDCTGWTPEERTAYALADNKLAANAGWDEGRLRAQLAELSAMDFNMSGIGFDTSELAKLLAPTGRTDPDDAPEPPEIVATVAGDVWVLGNHRLVCGSCTDPEAVALALNGVVPHLMVTDPPYGVEYDADWRNKAMRADGSAVGGRAIGKVENDNQADWRDAWVLFPGDVAYVWCAPGPLNCTVHDSLVAAGFPPRMQIVWAKSQLVIGRGHYHAQHENCWYAVRKGRTASWQGSRTESTLWDIGKPSKSETGHSTQKPLECMRRPIENNSKAGDAIYEPFSGSGTTIIAAEMTGRSCHAIELHPAYVDVAVRRWESFTGKEARLEATGQTFAEVAAARG
jgi:DNA modification methylase